jgi:hypothetical protein
VASTSGRSGAAERAAPRARTRRAAYGNEVRTRPAGRRRRCAAATASLTGFLLLHAPLLLQTSEAQAAVVTPDTLWAVRAGSAAAAARSCASVTCLSAAQRVAL